MTFSFELVFPFSPGKTGASEFRLQKVLLATQLGGMTK
jgi:hypothetical protein